jgi:galactofuranosylgalactofuranosylrhamnosyl-N-acetylglucosaminyl-diphospho-decaprenol beta-1,5/1,6-galactofuranosyltransferase
MTSAPVSPDLVADLAPEDLISDRAVTLLQRILMPRPADPRKVRSLYLDEERSQRVTVEDRETAHFAAGDEVSFGTYFNAFPAGYWRRWTPLTSVILRLHLSGRCRVDVYRSKATGETVHVIGASVTEAQPVVEVELDLTPFAEGGWYWFDLTADEDITVSDAGWYADREPLRAGKVAVGICTFNRPGDCVAAMATVAADPVVMGELAAVVVADQGNRKVRDDAHYADVAAKFGDRLHLVEQANLGGSGGFARAMHESLVATDATHILFLDDDVQLEADSIHRVLMFARFTHKPTLVGGQMLALQDRSVLHIMGEIVDRGQFLYRPAPHAAVGHDFARHSLRDAHHLHRRIDVDYNAWWMCLIPREVAEQLGLPLPLFIKWDDAEYGLRAGAAGYRTVTLPGAAIWHLSWSDKDDSTDWQAYFHGRNRLVVSSMYGGQDSASAICRHNIHEDLLHLLKMEYSAVALHIKAYEDFLAGPDRMVEELPTVLAKVRAEQSNYVDGQVITGEAPDPERGAVALEPLSRIPVGKLPIARAGLRAVRHNLRPGSGKDRPEIEIPARDAQWFILSQLDSATVGTADNRGVTLRRRDRAKFWKLARRSIELNLRIAREYPRLSASYRDAHRTLTATETWEKVFTA